MRAILIALNQRPIAYYPIYRQLTGSTTAGILLSQLMYWFSKGDKFYKTDADIRSETLLTVDELKGAKKRIKKLSFIKITREGIPAKTYYEIDWVLYQDELNKILTQTSESNSHDIVSGNSTTRCCNSHDTVSGNSTNCDREIPQTNNKNNNKNNNKTKIKEKKINKKKFEKNFSFELKKDFHYSAVSNEYKEKLKGRILLEFGIKGLNKFKDFEDSLLSKKSYRYYNFYRTFRKWYKDLQPIDLNKQQEFNTIKNLPKEYVYIGTQNNTAYAVNPKTFEIKIGKVAQNQTKTAQIPLETDTHIQKYSEDKKSEINANTLNLLSCLSDEVRNKEKKKKVKIKINNICEVLGKIVVLDGGDALSEYNYLANDLINKYKELGCEDKIRVFGDLYNKSDDWLVKLFTNIFSAKEPISLILNTSGVKKDKLNKLFSLARGIYKKLNIRHNIRFLIEQEGTFFKDMAKELDICYVNDLDLENIKDEVIEFSYISY